MAIKNRDYSVGEQLEALATIFRHVLNRGEDCVTIASEVEFIQNYMAIMESRFRPARENPDSDGTGA